MHLMRCTPHRMHACTLAGRARAAARRAEKRAGAGVGAEPSRVESSRGRANSVRACAADNGDGSSVCTLLYSRARSLAELTRASESERTASQGGQRSARSTYATSFTGVETPGHQPLGRSPSQSRRYKLARFLSSSRETKELRKTAEGNFAIYCRTRTQSVIYFIVTPGLARIIRV